MKKEKKSSPSLKIKKVPVKRSPDPEKKTRSKNKNFPIVGMGGSAGSFQAFESFFTHLPAESGMAFVIVVHLDPEHQGNLAGMMQNYTRIPIIEAKDGMIVKPDHIYVIPPNKDIGIHNKKLLLLAPSKKKGLRMPIDYFFQSLAEDQWNKAVGIIFSGMGSDGETGVRMIKEKLGMVMVQDPATARYNSMPDSALSTNLVDYLMAPEDMPVKLIQYLKHPALSELPTEQALSDTRNSHAVQKILMMLRSQTGHDFSLYKKNTITRRIDRRVAFHQLADYTKYTDFLRENPQEINILFNELLIGVTKFFRDDQVFEALKKRLRPLLQNKTADEPIRVWVAGCSTGEEAYSIAILISEYLETKKHKQNNKVQIFATDLDPGAIEHARQGVYLDNIVADVSPERIRKYFTKREGSYQVKKELREMIIYAQHNLIKDAPFTRLDLLSCRNLMIYLNAELQKKIIPIFHYALNPQGLLLIGPAETVGGFTDMFTHADAKWKLYERKSGSSTLSRMLDFPFNISRQNTHELKVEAGRPNRKASLQESFQKILLDYYTPPSILLDDRGDILFINGKTNRYLELPTGEPVMNISRMARDEIKYALSNAVHQARNSLSVITIKDIRLKEGKTMRTLTLRVSALQDHALEGLILVVFEDGGVIASQELHKHKKNAQPEPAIEELEKELSYTKQQLHSTIEQMESSVEELKSTNEELQSTNEELQSTNEESLTTKEEMQSLNEELMTINLQYQSKAEELTQLNNDMKNLLDNTEIGTIFLDNKLDILRFTPQVIKLFNVIPTDVGRSINHIVSNFQHAGLEEDVTEVIEKLTTKELEVKTRSGEWYNLRIIPYRTLDNFINGAVLTFHRITYLKVLEEKLHLIQRASALVVDAIKEPAVLLDHAYSVLALNVPFLKLFKLKEQEAVGQPFLEIWGRAIKGTKIDQLLKRAHRSQASLKVEWLLNGGELKMMNVAVRKVVNEHKKEADVIFITLTEV